LPSHQIDDLYYIPEAEKILHHLGSLIKANTIFLASNDLKTNKIIKAINKAEILVQEGTMLPFDDSYCSAVINNDINATVISDTALDSKTKGMTPTNSIGSNSFVGFPIKLRNGDVFGTLCSMDRNHVYTSEELDLIVSVAKFLGYLIDLERDMYVDQVTGLNTKSYLNMYFETIPVKMKKNFSIFLINIDRFKLVNTNETVGDYLLAVIAERLKSIIGKKGLLIRLHGDEFLLVNFELMNDVERCHYAEEILESIATPIITKYQNINLTARIGISSFNEEENTNLDTVIQQATFAMDEITGTRSKRYFLCTKEIIQKKERHLWIEANLINELEKNKFEMYYQPQYGLETNKIHGFEALIRWKTEKYGFISPAEFIPLAESTGLIIPLGNWIFSTVCKQIAEWNKLFGPNYTVAINISPSQLNHYEHYVDMLDNILFNYGILPQQLHFEITETSFLYLSDKIIPLLDKIRKKGINIALDDFGTGYSSVLYLRDLPINIIKIDRVFVKDLTVNEKDKIIISSLIELAKSLSIEVIAEGIEDNETLQLLKEYGCHVAQGYLLGKPMEALDALQLLAEIHPQKN
jgi:diguanylate cyclase (GGDEF)-like protein